MTDGGARRDPAAVLRDLGAALVAAAPPGTARIRYRATAVGAVRRDGFHAETAARNAVNVPVPDAVRDGVEELKQVMWTPEHGTWLELDLVLERETGQLEPRFNRTAEPGGPPLPREAFVEELRRFPRPPDAIPGWLAARLAPT